MLANSKLAKFTMIENYEQVRTSIYVFSSSLICLKNYKKNRYSKTYRSKYSTLIVPGVQKLNITLKQKF